MPRTILNFLLVSCIGTHGNVSFHKFPRDKVMFKKWIIAIKRDPGPDFVVGQFTRVCSKQFKPDDYIPNVASGRRFLKDNVVPTQFVFAKPVKQRRPPKERALRCSKFHKPPFTSSKPRH
nr:THAP domain-containing protein 2-like [Dermacentor andersoni]